MSSKYKKLIIAGMAVFVVVVVALLAAIWLLKRAQDNKVKQLGEVRQAASLDDYIESDQGLMHKQNMEGLQLAPKEVVPPVPTQLPVEKITMAPIMEVGGDAVYAAVGELPGNKFFRLEPDNLDKIFSVNTPDEALKYIDFLMVTAGRSSYDRARTTVWQTGDYEKLGCRVSPDEPNKPLPTNRPVSQAKVSGDGFEVTWIYFTPVLPAGYHKMVVQVANNGGITIEDNPNDAFWSCGGGIVF